MHIPMEANWGSLGWFRELTEARVFQLSQLLLHVPAGCQGYISLVSSQSNFILIELQALSSLH